MAQAAFQSDAFQVDYPGPLHAFQGFSPDIGGRYVQITQTSSKYFLTIALSVDRRPFMNTHARGDVVRLGCSIRDPSEVPALPFSPDSVEIAVLTPAEVGYTGSPFTMVELTTGEFEYLLQTDISDDTGAYTVSITAVSGSNTALTISQVAFILV